MVSVGNQARQRSSLPLSVTPIKPLRNSTPRTAFLTVAAFLLSKVWGERRDSNPRFPEPQSGALPLGHAHHRYGYSLRHIGMVVKKMRWSCGFKSHCPQLHLDVSYAWRPLLPRAAETTRGRSGRDSLPCPTRPRSRSRTPPARRRTRRPPRGRGARSSSRIPGPPRWPST